jgi:lipocalin
MTTEFSEQWKLVGTGAIGDVAQGRSVSLSSDGNTAIVGGSGDEGDKGAAWVYTRSGSVWTQQGSKLVGTGAIGNASQGDSVSLSSDGNTAIVGGPYDNGDTGAAWVYTRSGSVWTQQGKLVGTGAIGIAWQGASVSLSSDGNTAIVGGPHDNGDTGAAWVYTRSGNVWTQQGKLVGTGAIGIAGQGQSVSLSSDGDTAIVGGHADNEWKGAAWVYTRSGSVWTQQGSKLVGSGAIGTLSQQGMSVSLSSDGDTAIVGGPSDDYPGKGAAWVYARSGGVWTQQAKLIGSGATGIAPLQGSSVSLSSDGDTAIIGGPGDNDGKGAAWVYTRSGGVWTQQGSKLVGSGAIGTVTAGQGASVSVSPDGNTAIVGGPFDNEWKGSTWVYVKVTLLKELAWWSKFVTIDPMALILTGKALDIWYEIHHPHVPKVAEIQRVLRSMTPEEQKAALNRARILENYAKAEKKMLRSVPLEEQKAALNRAKILENYGKAVEEAFATMKK